MIRMQDKRVLGIRQDMAQQMSGITNLDTLVLLFLLKLGIF